ncbi:MAG: Copper-exporting P-type ATPase [Actinomycetota bacterium]|jgi:Cu2+-exporting ATPase
MKNSARPWFVALAVSLVALGYMGAQALGFNVPWSDWIEYGILIIGLFSVLPIWGAAIARLKQGKHRQDLLALVAILVSYGYALTSQDKNYFWQPIALTVVALLAGYLTHLQIQKVYGSKPDLSGILTNRASVIDGRDVEHVAATDLEIGQVVLVRTGLTIPADGYVIQGQAMVSQTAITGESEPVKKVAGDWVLAGTQNLSGKGDEFGPITIRVSAVGDDLLVHEIVRCIDLENVEPARFSKFSAVASNALTIGAIAGALVAAGIEMILGHTLIVEFSVASAILVSAQVGAVALAGPLASAASSIKAAVLGFVVHSRKSFEKLAKVNHVVFNKTGVITQGHRKVGAIHLARNTSIGSEEELLALAAAVELGTSHELGHLIIEEAVRRGLELPAVSDISPIPGLGVSARFDGSLVQVGNAGMVNVTGVSMNPYDLFRVSSAYSEGSSVVFISVDELLVGYIEFPDQVRVGAAQAIIDLSGKHAITILSGDATSLVEKITKSLGIEEFAAEVLSTRRADWVKERRANGSKLLLVADGHYDAAALAEADVAIAFGAGHQAHQASAELVLVSQDPIAVPRLISLSKKTQSRTLWNVLIGIVLTGALATSAVFGVPAPLIAFIGLLGSWVLNQRIVGLLK